MALVEEAATDILAEKLCLVEDGRGAGDMSQVRRELFIGHEWGKP